MTIQMKATEQLLYFSVMVFILRYNVILTLKSVSEILKFDYKIS